MDPQGWVKLHRKLLDNPIASNPNLFALFVLLLLSAAHKDVEFFWNGKKTKLRPGQLITGREVLAKKFKVSHSSVDRWLELLETEQQIEQQKNNKYRLITILNWDKYQIIEQQNEPQKSNKRATKEQQKSTYKNYNNDNKSFTSKTEEVEPPLDPIKNEVNQVFELFYEKINPMINFGNTTERKACEILLKKFGLEKVINTVDYYLTVRDQEFVPIIKGPLDLKNKLVNLIEFSKRKQLKEQAPKRGIDL